MGIDTIIRGFVLTALIAALTACASGVTPAIEAAELADEPRLEDYRLGPADRVRLIVFGEPDLSGEFAVNSRGEISVPLLGDVDVNNLTVDELNQKIAQGLSNGYVNDARVAAEVIAFRPYYILGEVTRPGEYPYSAGMNVIKAVAAAQGFTYRANKSVVFIKRANRDEELKFRLTPDLILYPGDVVRVGERFF